MLGGTGAVTSTFCGYVPARDDVCVAQVISLNSAYEVSTFNRILCFSRVIPEFVIDTFSCSG